MARPPNRNAQRRPGQRPGGRRPAQRGRSSFRAGFGGGASSAVLERQPVELASRMTVQELADRLGASPQQVISELVRQNILLTINQTVDYETAATVAGELGYEVFEASATDKGTAQAEEAPAEDDAQLQPRS